MDKKLAFIGGGNMATSLIRGLLDQGLCPPEQIRVSGPHLERLQPLEELGVRTGISNIEAAQEAEIIILAVKPGIIPLVLSELQDSLSDDKLIISLAAGITLQRLQAGLGRNMPIIRAMPNTPAAVGEGVTALSQNDAVRLEDMADASEIFGSCGMVEWVDESLLDAVIGIAGSAPAYFFMMAEAMADAAVRAGMKRSLAYRMAAQSMVGAGRMILDSGRHPGLLKDEVSSPGGTTIAAVAELEAAGFRSAVIRGVEAAVERSRDMSRLISPPSELRG